jgi:nucleoside-diphosphate-sugar epimerase
VFSTACVYPYVPTDSGGATEETPLLPPPGDYANSCVARERAFDYGSQRWGTPGRIARLEYSIDKRYGVLYDVASKVFAVRAGRCDDGARQRDLAGAMPTSRSCGLLAHCTAPATPLNISGPDTVSVRSLAEAFGQALRPLAGDYRARIASAWLVNTKAAQQLLGPPRVPLERMIDWVADWVSRAMPSLASRRISKRGMASTEVAREHLLGPRHFAAASRSRRPRTGTRTPPTGG